MSAIWLILGGIVIFLIAYTMYGAWLAKEWGIDVTRKTPAHTKRDNVDYCPAKAPVLLGHHFASIAGAGPITGPIAASFFGWVPVALWIIIGSIFVGGVHDFGALFASIRHDGKSIGEIIEVNIGKSGKKLFAAFAWLTLVLVVAAFLNVTASAFVSTPAAGTSSLLFIILAVVFGFGVYRKGANLMVSTIVGLVLLFFCIWVGQMFPIVLGLKTWIWILVFYIFAASVLPVWMLLQPRDYLNSFLLYAMIFAAVVGIFITNPVLELTPYAGFYVNKQYLFPMLFVTVACGAISGFHALVGSGTTAKQIDTEHDAKLVGYGSMLIEGVLALIALTTAAYVAGPKLAELSKAGGPINVFASGVGNFTTVLGLDFTVGKQFAALALSAFALTSLDTATRLGRFIFQEFFNENSEMGSFLGNRFVSTGITTICGAFLGFKGWSIVWPLFGSANQLLAAIALISIAVYLKKAGKNNTMLTIPTFFMFAVSLTALVFLVKSNLIASNFILAGFGILLFVLAVILLVQAWNVLNAKDSGKPPIKA